MANWRRISEIQPSEHESLDYRIVLVNFVRVVDDRIVEDIVPAQFDMETARFFIDYGEGKTWLDTSDPSSEVFFFPIPAFDGEEFYIA